MMYRHTNMFTGKEQRLCRYLDPRAGAEKMGERVVEELKKPGEGWAERVSILLEHSDPEDQSIILQTVEQKLRGTDGPLIQENLKKLEAEVTTGATASQLEQLKRIMDVRDRMADQKNTAIPEPLIPTGQLLPPTATTVDQPEQLFHPSTWSEEHKTMAKWGLGIGIAGVLGVLAWKALRNRAQESADAAKRAAEEKGGGFLKKTLVMLGVGAAVLLGAKWYTDKSLKDLKDRAVAGAQAAGETAERMAETAVDAAKKILPEQSTEPSTSGPDTAAELAENVPAVGLNLVGRGLVVMHGNLVEQAGLQSALSQAQVGAVLNNAQLRSLPLTELQTIATSTSIAEGAMRSQQVCERNGIPFADEEQFKAVYFLSLVCREHETDMTKLPNAPRTMDDVLQNLHGSASAFANVLQHAEGKSTTEILTNLPHALQMSFREVESDSAHLQQAVDQLGLSNANEKTQFLAFCAAHPGDLLKSPAGLDTTRPEHQRFQLALKTVQQRIDDAREHLLLYGQEDRFKAPLTTALEKLTLVDALRVYALLSQLQSIPGGLPNRLDAVPAHIALPLQLTALGLIGKVDAEAGKAMSIGMFVETGAGVLGISEKISLPPQAKKILAMLGSTLLQNATAGLTGIADTAWKGFQEIYRNNPETIIGTEVGIGGVIAGKNAVSRLLWQDAPKWNASQAQAATALKRFHQRTGSIRFVGRSIIQPAGIIAEKAIPYWATKIAGGIGHTGGRVARWMAAPFRALTRPIGRVPGLGRVLRVTRPVTRVLGPIGAGLTAQDYLASERPELLRRIAAEKDETKKARLEEELVSRNISKGIDTGTLFFAASPWGLGIYAGNQLKELARNSINEGTDYLQQNEADLRKQAPGQILWNVNRTNPGHTVSWGQRMISLTGVSNANEEGNEAIRHQAYASYFYQRAPFTLPAVTAAEIVQTAPSADPKETQKTIRWAMDTERGRFTQFACEYVRQMTNGQWTLATADILQEAETYARLQTLSRRQHLLGGKEPAPLFTAGTPAELRAQVAPHLREFQTKRAEHVTALLNAPETRTLVAPLELLTLAGHDMALAEERLLSADYSDWSTVQVNLTMKESDESMRNLARSTLSELLRDSLNALVRKAQSGTVTVQEVTQTLDTMRTILHRNPDELAKETLKQPNLDYHRKNGSIADLLSVPGMRGLLQLKPLGDQQRQAA